MIQAQVSRKYKARLEDGTISFLHAKKHTHTHAYIVAEGEENYSGGEGLQSSGQRVKEYIMADGKGYTFMAE